MISCWNKFQSGLWKDRQIEDKHHGEIQERTKQEELHAWEDFAISNYVEPLPALKPKSRSLEVLGHESEN